MGHVRGEALNRLYADSKIVIGDTLNLPGNEYYWSDRVYETLGRGGFLIHPYIKGLTEEFTDKEHLVFYEYGNFDQLAELIEYYLRGNHQEERERIRQNGHQLVKDHCTYTQRLNQVLETVGLTRGQK
jgi:spore maturation protein CgeB